MIFEIEIAWKTSVTGVGDKCLFTHSDSVMDPSILMGEMGMQPIFPVIISVKRIKGDTGQWYGDGDGVSRCGWVLKIEQNSAQRTDSS